MSHWYSKWDSLELPAFLETLAGGESIWIAKRLSGNDTGLTGGHQVGVYFPEIFFQKVFPEICRKDIKNPDSFIKHLFFISHNHMSDNLRAIYYNNKYTDGGTRDEFRLTRWDGKTSPVQSVENTGALLLFSIHRDPELGLIALAWVCRNEVEEVLVENWIGEEVFPGEFKTSFMVRLPKIPLVERIWKTVPNVWHTIFPSGGDVFRLIERSITLASQGGDVDKLLMKRREAEYSLYKKIEEGIVLPKVLSGFTTIDQFVSLANEITNRRKSRTGRSLELNLESIFKEKNVAFETQVITENKKKPDFIFPSAKAYHDISFSTDRLHMLGAKTCCKERWRQIVSEAHRIPEKHLFTLQEGVSDNQLKEMEDAGVKLVVPEGNKSCFPKDWRKKLMALGEFVEMRKSVESL